MKRRTHLLAHLVVGTHDAGLHAGADTAGEDAAKGVEASAVSGGHHLGDVQHQGTLGVALPDGGAVLHRG